MKKTIIDLPPHAGVAILMFLGAALLMAVVDWIVGV